MHERGGYWRVDGRESEGGRDVRGSVRASVFGDLGRRADRGGRFGIGWERERVHVIFRRVGGELVDVRRL